ncbi:MAG: DegT/DnrJ/EryC1/StrS family aminotransferase [Paracoccaceae bacterium]|nr:DegT/DnrJ/EryC1/StrS family aminotransferase [Paracoccaceae bacterium]
MQFVDLYSQHQELEPALSETISRVIRESSFIRGPEVDQFEQNWAKAAQVPHCVSCANGTDALYIAMRALGTGPGDEVITTAHSWISTSETITQCGAHVVFADTEARSFNLDPEDVKRRITPKTKGIVVVHLYGQPANMAALSEIARENNLWLIEDSAQAHLATYDDQPIGSFGDVATFSFYPGKNLGAMGDAGGLVTARQDIADFATAFARHGGKGLHVMEGICSRMDGLQAAILNLKLPHLERWTEARIARADIYDRLFQNAGLAGEQVQIPWRAQNARHVFHLYVIKIKERDALRQHLNDRGVPTGIHYQRALPLYPAYDHLGYSAADIPNASQAAEQILSLPLHPHLEEADQVKVVEAIAAFYEDP